MSAVSKTYTFVPETDIEAAKVNQNFDDLVSYTNAEVIVRDASKAFTAIPSGPGTDPTSPDQFARKQYVDQRVKIDGTTPFTGIPSGPNSNPTTENQFTRKKYVDDSAVTPLIARPTVSNIATNPIIKAQEAVVTIPAGANGVVTVLFPTAFPTECTNVVVTNGDSSTPTQFMTVNLKNTTGFVITCYSQEVVAGPFGGFVLARSTGAVRVSYIAFGR
jgi:hypothetical protein